MTKHRDDQAEILMQLNPWLATAQPMLDTSVKLASELTDFTLRRMKEDVRLPERLASCRSPQDVQQAWIEFWQRAFDQYQGEWQRLAEINRAGLAVATTVPRQHEHSARVAA